MIHAENVRVTETTIHDTPRSLVRWGAVFAGLAALMGASWLMFLLGSALGVGLADATNEASKLGFGVTVWLVLTALGAYFFGGLVVGRLTGTLDTHAGMWHGVILWGFATAVMLVLGWLGITGMVAAGASLTRGVAEVGGQVAAATAQTAQTARDEGRDSEPGTDFGAAIERRLGHIMAANAGLDRESDVDVDAETLKRATTAWVADGPDAAKRVLADETTLSQQEIDRAFEQLSDETGDKVAAIEANVGRAVEKTADVAQSVLWGFFLFSALGLVASIWGGRVGADLTRRFMEHVAGRPAAE